jgi:hypothetical protein
VQRHIYNSCLGAYPPADEYAKPFYCLAFGLNMKSGQISVATAIADVFFGEKIQLTWDINLRKC